MLLNNEITKYNETRQFLFQLVRVSHTHHSLNEYCIVMTVTGRKYATMVYVCTYIGRE